MHSVQELLHKVKDEVTQESSNSKKPPSDLERKYDFKQTNFEVFTKLGYSFK